MRSRIEAERDVAVLDKIPDKLDLLHPDVRHQLSQLVGITHLDT
jgi:hypothetical protein